jgi:hypothetical protein
MLVEIQDPVAGFSYTFDTQNKIAHRAIMQTSQSLRLVMGGGQDLGMAIAPAPPVQGNAANTVRSGVLALLWGLRRRRKPPAGRVRRMKQEDLGPQVIEEVLATGHRITQTWPAGSQG